MNVPHLTRRLALAGTAAALLASTAYAHLGWAWAEEETFTLTGAVEEIYLGHPHARLRIKAEEGNWDVDLAPPIRTRRAGFDGNTARVGDQVTAIGNRSRDHNQLWMKAATIELNAMRYDVYPDRVQRP